MTWGYLTKLRLKAGRFKVNHRRFHTLGSVSLAGMNINRGEINHWPQESVVSFLVK